MVYTSWMTKDILIALCFGVVGTVLAFFITVNLVDWHLFRYLPDDATRGITENIYGMLAGVISFPAASIAAFVSRRRRAES